MDGWTYYWQTSRTMGRPSVERTRDSLASGQIPIRNSLGHWLHKQNIYPHNLTFICYAEQRHCADVWRAMWYHINLPAKITEESLSAETCDTHCLPQTKPKRGQLRPIWWRERSCCFWKQQQHLSTAEIIEERGRSPTELRNIICMWFEIVFSCVKAAFWPTKQAVQIVWKQNRKSKTPNH